MSDLKPCPFCGGEAQTLNQAPKGTGYSVGCHDDECRGFIALSWIYATEAEAIAAWNSRADYHGYEQAAIEAWESIKAWNTRVAHGTLTAEQVREIVDRHWHDLSDEYDIPEATALPEYSYDWQAIADELNSRVKPPCDGGYCPLCGAIERTCKQEERGWCTEGDHARVWLTCGHDCMVPTVQDLPNYCPNCGARVVE